MKTSYTKRALAFWLAVAMLATGAPAALAREPDTGTGGSTSVSGTTTTPEETTEPGTPTAQLTMQAPSVSLTVGTAIQQVAKFTATGGTGTVTYAIESGKLPEGVTLNSETGEITGTPTTAETSEVTVKATDSSSHTDTVQWSYNVQQGSLSGATITLEKETYAYTGEAIHPEVTAVQVGGTTVPASDYTVTYGNSNTDVGNTAKVIVTGKNNYKDSAEKAFTIEKADLKSFTVGKISVKQRDSEDAVEAALKQAITATGVQDEPVEGTVKITKATRTGDLPSAQTFSNDFFTDQGGEYKIEGTFTPTDSNYNAKDFETTCDVTGTTEVTLSFTGIANGKKTVTYGDAAFKAEATASENTHGAITYTSSNPEVATVSNDGTVTIKNVGKTTITANMQGTQTTTAATASYELTVNTAAHRDVPVSESVFANQAKEYTFDLPQEIKELDGVIFGEVSKDDPLISTASVENQKLKVSVTSQNANTTGTVTIPVTSKNYADFNLVYTLTAVNKTDVSSKISFADKTVTYTGKSISLNTPTISGITESGTGAWTYTWSKDGVQTTAAGQTTMPSFTEVGTYRVTATYEDDANLGRKTATLTIKPATTSIISLYDVSQISSSRDDNYRYFDVDMGTPRDNYVRVNVDADDDLDKQRVDGTSSEWIGLVLEPTQNGTKKTSGLYVSDDKKEWTSLRDDIRMGDFYIDDVDSTSFELWYDTDDRDCSKSLYLATDTNGSNLFEIDVDFDSYSGSSSSSSGSSSSDTSKKDGDRVSTTTIDKTPSVKSRSATVTFSSSAMSDALDENKREARHEDADVTYIELDARTSKTVDDTTITVPRKSLDNIADEDTGLILTTNHGTFTFDDRALAEIYDTCDKTNIDFYIEEEDDDQYIVLIKDGSDDVIDLGSGEVEIVFDYRLKSGEKSSDVNVYRIGDGDKEFDYARDMKADYSSSKKEATFTTDTLGTFLVTTDTLKTGSDSTTTTPPTTPAYSRFVDVPSSRWSATYINKLASLGIINGTGGGYFEPTLQVTREEFVKMLAGVAGANVSGYTSSRFPDVPMSRWSASYIAWAADRGITTGTDGGRFAPTMKITREEMATMIYRYVQISGKTLPAKNAPVTFADADQISSWAQTAVSVMQQAGIIDGNVTNGRYTFDPKVPASREECAKMLSILYDLL